MFVTHLESALDGTRLPADAVQTVHQGRPLWVRYDLAAVKKAVSSLSTCVCVTSRVATIGLPERRY